MTEIIVNKKPKRQEQNESKIADYWWLNSCKENDLALSIFETTNSIIRFNASYYSDAFTASRMYSNQDYDSFMPSAYTLFSPYFNMEYNESLSSKNLTFNLISSVIDTLVAKIAKSNPSVRFVTNDGDWGLQKKAKQLSKIMDGTFVSSKFNEIAKLLLRDACIYGTGCAKIYTNDDDEMVVDRIIYPLEIIMDKNNSRYSDPKELYYKKLYSKPVLMNMFPELADKIADVSTITTKSNVQDQVVVIEAYHLPLSKKSKGRRVICVEGLTLLDEEWNKKHFPFVFIKYKDQIMDFAGSSLVGEIISLQVALTKTYKMIDYGQEVNSIPRVYVEEGSLASKSAFYNVGVVEYKKSASKPEIVAAPAANGDIYNYQNTLERKGYDQTGISQLSASSRKPEGLDSGVAIRESQDIETERFSIVAKNFQQLFIDASKLFIDCYRDVYKDNPTLKLKQVGGTTNKYIKTIDWKDCDLSEDEYMIDAFPVSQLPKSPEGRLNYIKDLIDLGILKNQAQITKLLDMPDLEEYSSLQNSSIDLAFKHIDLVIQEKNSEVAPNKYMDLNLTLSLFQAEYLKLQNNDADNTILALMEDYMEQIVLLLDEANAKTAAPAPQPMPQAPMPVA